MNKQEVLQEKAIVKGFIIMCKICNTSVPMLETAISKHHSLLYSDAACTKSREVTKQEDNPTQ